MSSSISPRAVLAAWEANSFLQELQEQVALPMVTRSGRHQWELKTGPSTPTPRPLPPIHHRRQGRQGSTWVLFWGVSTSLPHCPATGTRAELDLCVRESIHHSVFSNSL